MYVCPAPATALVRTAARLPGFYLLVLSRRVTYRMYSTSTMYRPPACSLVPVVVCIHAYRMDSA
ncbi:hypothetical protein OH77DRAFT_1093260 [Trametes cingulata]|nr:hypothetical protein OH77DRAFT_1093260 [Trametes cingulata]